MGRTPECGHRQIADCPLTKDDWWTVFVAYQAFLAACRMVSDEAHKRAAKRERVA